MNFVSNTVTLAVLVTSGWVVWLLGLCMGASLMVGAYSSARTAIGGEARFIRPMPTLMVPALTARLTWQHWFSGT